jgi:hypothetical protein
MAQKIIAGFFGVTGIILLVSAVIAWFLGGLTNPYGGYSRSGQPLNPQSLMEVGEPIYSILGIVHWSMILAVILGAVGYGFLAIAGKIMSKFRKKAS